MTAAERLQHRPSSLRAPLPTPEILHECYWPDGLGGGDLELAFGARHLDVGIEFDLPLRIEIQVVSGAPLTPVEASHVERWVREHVASMNEGDSWQA